MNYSGIEGIYYRAILRKVIKMGQLDKLDVRILDFGCGQGKLKEMLKGTKSKVIGYDIDKNLTDVKDWKKVRFDVVVVNSVFYLMSARDIKHTIKQMLYFNPDTIFIISFSNRGWINKLFLKLTYNNWDNTLTTPENELEILKQQLMIEKQESVWELSTIFKMIKVNCKKCKGTGKIKHSMMEPWLISCPDCQKVTMKLCKKLT